jgi:hypothetical protein
MVMMMRNGNHRRGLALALGLALAPVAAFAGAEQPFVPLPLPATMGGSGALSAAAAVTVIPYGTSLTAGSENNNAGTYSGGTVTPGTACTTACASMIYTGYTYWLNLYTDNRINRAVNTNNLGVYSDLVTDMAPSGSNGRFQTLTTLIRQASGPVVVPFQGGDNDPSAGESCSTIVAALRQSYAGLQQLGAIVIRPSIYPRGAPNAFTTAQQQVVDCVNQADIRYAEEGHPGFYVVNMDGVIGNPGSTTAAPYSGYLQSDGVHLTPTGASAYGYAIAQQINQLFPNWRSGFLNASDVYNATNNPAGNLVGNGGFQVTSGGTVNTGASGTAAGSWTLSGNSVSGLTVAGAVNQLTSASGVLPKGAYYQSVTLSGTYTAASGAEAFALFQFACSGGACSNFSAGDVVEACVALRIGANTNLAGVPVQLTASDNSQSINYQGGALAAASYSFPSGGFIDGVFHEVCTPRYTIQTPLTFVALTVAGFLYTGTSATAAGEIDIGGPSVRQVLR